MRNLILGILLLCSGYSYAANKAILADETSGQVQNFTNVQFIISGTSSNGNVFISSNLTIQTGGSLILGGESHTNWPTGGASFTNYLSYSGPGTYLGLARSGSNELAITLADMTNFGLWGMVLGSNWVDNNYYPRSNPSNWVTQTITNDLVRTNDTRTLEFTGPVRVPDGVISNDAVNMWTLGKAIPSNVELWFETNTVSEAVAGVRQISTNIPAYSVTLVSTSPAVGDYLFTFMAPSNAVPNVQRGAINSEVTMRRTGNPASTAEGKWESYITNLVTGTMPEYAETSETINLLDVLTKTDRNCYAPSNRTLTASERYVARFKLTSGSGAYGNIEFQIGSAALSDQHMSVAGASGSTGGGDVYLANDQVFTGSNTFAGKLMTGTNLYIGTVPTQLIGVVDAVLGTTDAGTLNGKSDTYFVATNDTRTITLSNMSVSNALALGGTNASSFITTAGGQSIGGTETFSNLTYSGTMNGVGAGQIARRDTTNYFNGNQDMSGQFTITNLGYVVLGIAASNAASSASIGGMKARGTVAAPAFPAAGDAIFRIFAGGWNGTNIVSNNRAEIEFIAESQWTNTSQPTAIAFFNTLSNAVGRTESARINSDRSMKFTDVSSGPATPTGGSVLYSTNGSMMVKNTDGVEVPLNAGAVLNPTTEQGYNGYALGDWNGPNWSVAFSDTDAYVSCGFWVAKGGTFKAAMVWESTSANTSKTMSGKIYCGHSISGGAFNWDYFFGLNWDLAIPNAASTLAVSTYGTAFTIPDNSNVTLRYDKDDNAGGASGSIAVHYMLLVRQ